MSKLKKVLSDQEINAFTQAGGFNTVLCTQARILCNMYWPDFLAGFQYTDDAVGNLDCGTCSYMVDQCGWKYVYSGTGSTAWQDCKWICTCH